MIPNVAKPGTSFKGALAYYLHDKAREGEDQAQVTTSERVAWTQTRNLATDKAEMAGRVMAATAMDQDRLKRAAGIKATGRKSAAAVYAYSLAWHPEEAGRISKSEMLRAAEESLTALGAQDRQAIIVAHQDEPHPHVHVIVNRVSMDDGRMLSTSNDHRKLDKWALAYRQARGEEQRYCPARAKKAEAIAQKRAGKEVGFVRGDKTTPRHMEPAVAAARAAAPEAALQERDRQKALNAQLGADTRQMRRRQDQAWRDLSKRSGERVAEIRTQSAAAEDRARAQVKEQFAPDWRSLLRRQHQERQEFAEREKTVGGKLKNAVEAVLHRRQLDPESSRGFLGPAFTYLTKAPAREAALSKLHAAQRRSLSADERAELGAAVHAIQSDRGALLATARVSFNADRAALIESHGREREEMQIRWRERGREQTRAFDTIRRKAEVRAEAKATQKPQQAKEQDNTRAEHRAASEGRKRSKTRVRKRTRKRSED